MEDRSADRHGMGADAADGVRPGRGDGRASHRPRLSARLKRFTSQLVGRADVTLVNHLEAQIHAALEGAQIAKRAIAGSLDSAEARDQMRKVEHAGDAERAKLVQELYESFMSPVDREDLFRLSRSTDDVLDNLRDFVRELDLLNVQGEKHYVHILEALIEGLHQLGEAVHQIAVEIADVPRSALAAKKAGSHMRQLYQVAIADILSGDEVDMAVLRKRELLRRLDVVGLRLGEAADALADGAMKRSH